MSFRRYDDYYFPKSSPRTAKGGIKAQTQRGSFGKSWWAKRWIAVLEGFNIGARLGRGRTYARKGQVLSVEIEKGQVQAKVQGSRPRPYNISLKVKVLTEADWKKLAREISHQAIFAAKLLAGEMPQDIEKAFQSAGLSLFPEKSKDLETDCSCPDWSNPCKHIAAVYYLLGEEFDRDPFLIFKLRGMTREEIMDLLGRDIGFQAPYLEAQALAAEKQIGPAYQPEPLPTDMSGFWQGGKIPDHLFGEVRLPNLQAGLVRRLGNFPFWRGEEKFLESMERIYSQAAPRGWRIFLGEISPCGINI